ncbi:MAG: tRNA1(Val) (adenine(37)-N6)-methyltransferase [Chloroflexota bacterium]
MISSSETLDALFDGRLTLLQSRSGYRFSLDALLLAYFVTVKRGDQIVDLGTGNGVLALILAFLHPLASLTGVELQSAMADRARRNVELNGLDERIKILHADVRRIADRMNAASFDAAVCNPPYRKPSSGRISANVERQAARHETQGELHDFLRAAAHLLRHKGRMALCYPAVRLSDLITVMRQVRIEPKRLRMVHSFRHAKASLTLVEGIKGGRAGLAVASPLIIYRQNDVYDDEVAAMIAGAQA